MNKKIKLQKMREWVIANPQANVHEFVKKTGGNSSQFYNLRYNYGVAKKRNAHVAFKQETPKTVTVSVAVKRPMLAEFEAINKRMTELQALLDDVVYQSKQLSKLAEEASNLVSQGEDNGTTV